MENKNFNAEYHANKPHLSSSSPSSAPFSFIQEIKESLKFVEENAPKSFCIGLREDRRKCLLCFEYLSEAPWTISVLPCSHHFHKECVEKHKLMGVEHVCPECRLKVPRSPEKTYANGCDIYFHINLKMNRGDGSWRSLCSRQQMEMVEVLRLWQTAAADNHVYASLSLGVLFDTGRGVEQDEKVAFRWYMKAANLGNCFAQCLVGDMYMAGRGVGADHKESFEWYSAAAKQGHGYALEMVGSMYFEGCGTRQSDRKAVETWKRAANKGQVRAFCNLGFMSEHGRGTEKSLSEAFLFYRKAAEMGCKTSQCAVAIMYTTDKFGVKNMAEAARWYDMAARQGVGEAQYNLAFMYETGDGVLQDQKKALRWYHEAAKKGVKAAQDSIDKILKKSMLKARVVASDSG